MEGKGRKGEGRGNGEGRAKEEREEKGRGEEGNSVSIAVTLPQESSRVQFHGVDSSHNRHHMDGVRAVSPAWVRCRGRTPEISCLYLPLNCESRTFSNSMYLHYT